MARKWSLSVTNWNQLWFSKVYNFVIMSLIFVHFRWRWREQRSVIPRQWELCRVWVAINSNMGVILDMAQPHMHKQVSVYTSQLWWWLHLGCQNASHYYLQQFSRIISPEQSEYTIKLIFLNNCDCMKIKYVNYR